MNRGPSFQAGKWHQQQRHSKNRDLDPQSQGAPVQRKNGPEDCKKAWSSSQEAQDCPTHWSAQGLANSGLGRRQRCSLRSPCT